MGRNKKIAHRLVTKKLEEMHENKRKIEKFKDEHKPYNYRHVSELIDGLYTHERVRQIDLDNQKNEDKETA